MADKTINELTAASTMTDDDLLVLQQNGVAKKLSGKSLGSYVSSAAEAKVNELNTAIDNKISEVQQAIDDAETDINSIVTAVQNMTELGTDTTLTTSGMAADAKATGDNINDLQSAISNAETISETQLNFTIETGHNVSYTTGALNSADSTDVTNYIDISKYTQIKFKNIGIKSSSTSYGMAFYDENLNFITGIAAIPYQTVIAYVAWDCFASVPDRAKFARFTLLHDTATYGELEIYGLTTLYKNTKTKFKKRVFNVDYVSGSIANSTGRGAERAGTFRSSYVTASESCHVHMTATDNLLISMYKYSSVSQTDFMQIVFFRRSGSYDFWVEEGAVYRYEVRSIDGSELTEVSDGNVIFIADSTNRFLWADRQKTRFNVKINLNWPNVNNTNVDTQETDTNTDILCIVTLPPNYRTTGKPVPLIMFGHGSSGQITYNSWYTDTSFFDLLITSFRDAGYAVFDVNNTRDVEGGFPDWGSLPLMSAYIKAWNYIKQNYNVEEKLYIYSCSAGTPANLNMLKWYGANIVTSIMAAPRPFCKYRYETAAEPGKSKMAEAFGLTDGIWDNDRLKGFNHYENIITLDNVPYVMEHFPPVKVMVGLNDTSFLTEVREYYQALKNAGNVVNYREIDGLDHDQVCFLKSPALRAEAVEWFNRFRNE